MVAALLGGELGKLRAECERLRSDCALAATVNAELAAQLLERQNDVETLRAKVQQQAAAIVETADVFGFADTIGGESLPDYVRRRMARGAELVRQLDGGGLKTHERMALMAELKEFFSGAAAAPIAPHELPQREQP